jgi:hypothetical protein
MFRQPLQPKTLLKKTLAALSVITLSGVYFLFCCQEMYASNKSAHQPAEKSEHCHFSKSKKSETPRAAAGVNICEHCGLRFNFFVAKLEKNQFPQKTPALANNFFHFLKSVNPANKAGFTGFSYRAPVFENRDLHIKNCVFRI